MMGKEMVYYVDNSCEKEKGRSIVSRLTKSQEDDRATLHMAAAVMLSDGRTSESTFELMQREAVFPRLVELIRDQDDNDDEGAHKLFLELLFEMSRMQRLKRDEISKPSAFQFQASSSNV